MKIVLQQEFLPTDVTVNVPFLLTWAFPILGGLAGLLIILVLLADIFKKYPAHKWWHDIPSFASKMIIAILVVLMAMTFVALGDFLENKEKTEETSVQNLIDNITSIYDIELVEGIEIEKTGPDSNPTAVVVQDNVGYEVMVRQNPETYEPTLIVIASPDSEVTSIRKK